MFWGLISQGQVLKVRVPSVGHRPFTPLGQAPGFEFPPQVWVSMPEVGEVKGTVGWWWAYGSIVSQPFLLT